MKITLGSKNLLEKLQFLGGVIPSNTTLPIISNFLFDIHGKELKITATDLETTISSTIEIEESEKGLVCVPARMLLEILKAFPDQPLSFEIKKDNTIEISSECGKYSIAYSDGTDYPKYVEVEKPTTIAIPSDVLRNAITKTIFATGDDPLRSQLQGVLFQMTQTGTNFAATDAHKLVKYSRTDLRVENDTEFIVHKKPMALLKSILAKRVEPIAIEFNTNNASFQLEDYKVTCRLVDAKYPNYEAVIPKENPNKLTIDRNQLLNSLKCVSIFSNKLTHQIRLKISGTELNISAEDADYSNKADERLTCNYEGDDLTIVFNSKFLIEILSSLQCETVVIEMSQPNKAGIIKPVDGECDEESLLMLIMPTLISQ